MNADFLKIQILSAHLDDATAKKDWNTAMKCSEMLMQEMAKYTPKDDETHIYTDFDEPFEEILFVSMYNTGGKKIVNINLPMLKTYTIAGCICNEFKQYDAARKALEVALQWNPVCFMTNMEYLETFKAQGEIEEFFEKTKAAFKIAFRGKYIARLYRNIGWYFSEKEMWQEAVNMFIISTAYGTNEEVLDSELEYIKEKGKFEIETPTPEELAEFFKKYDIPCGADEDVVGIARACLEANKENENAVRYFQDILDEIVLKTI